MKREEKEALVEGLHEKFSRAKALILTDFRGLDTSSMNALRNQLREASVEFRVVKNTLMSMASDGTDVAVLKDYFSGPSAKTGAYSRFACPDQPLSS